MNSHRINRRVFINAGVITASSVNFAAAQTSKTGPPTELDEITIANLRSGLASGTFTARMLADVYLARIAAIDKKGPALRSVIEVNPDALSIADELDREFKAKGPRGPLHGIPVLIKDNIATSDRMATTAGSLALVGAKPPHDAFIVKRMREAGMVILGKSNLSEWANFRSNRSTSGWSGRGGQTRNPYALDRNPSGSSSGSAVAVSSNLCALAVGTETDGSIISPSSNCGVVGLKPTVGLVSRSGIIPISKTQDTAGPMARCVADAAALLNVLAGMDAQDSATAASHEKSVADYTRFLDAEGLKGTRLGVVRRHFAGLHERNVVLMNEALAVLKNAGAELVDPVEIEGMAKIANAEITVMLYEFKAGLKDYFESLGSSSPIKSLADLIAFNDRNKAAEMPYFGQETLIRAEAKGGLTEKEYTDALKRCAMCSRTEGIDAVMEKHKLDALIAPSSGPAAVTDLIWGTRGTGGSSSAAAVAGYPNITVPAGYVHGMPVGLSFFGRAWSEPTLLKMAYSFEQATRHRKPPRFAAHAETG